MIKIKYIVDTNIILYLMDMNTNNQERFFYNCCSQKIFNIDGRNRPSESILNFLEGINLNVINQ